MSSAPRPAAVVILLRKTATGTDEVYWVRRSQRMRFLPGFHTFPGGRVSADDGGAKQGALRELFEEAGLLLVRPADAPARLGADRLREQRRALLDGTRTFARILEDDGLELDQEALAPAGRWITPAFAPVRYDTEFFLARVAADTCCEVSGEELDDGEWISPARALERWQKGEVLLAPPALHALRELARGVEGIEKRLRAPEEAQGNAVRRVEFLPGLVLVPLRSPTLPPATHTNCMLVGTDGVLVVDPGSPYPEEQEALAAVIDGIEAEGRSIEAVLLTHHHYDHVAGAAAVAARTGAPIVAHARTAKLLANGPKVDRTVDDGECWQAGAVGRVRGIFTPGHAPGHMAFLCERMGLLLAGDLVAGVGTVIVDPADGDMIDYLDSLKRVSSLGIRTIIPAHGPAIFGAEAALEDLLEHRYFREAKILEALGRAGRAGPPTLEAILPEVYDDTPERQWPLAARSLEAHLIKLEREGRIERKGGAIRLLA